MMKIHRIVDADGRFFAFEIDNIYIQPRKVAAVLRNIEGVTEVRRRKMFRLPSDVHVVFKYNEKPYMVWEPWADSSRYWIGPEQDGARGDISPIATVFEQYNPRAVVKWLGKIMTLNFTSRK